MLCTTDSPPPARHVSRPPRTPRPLSHPADLKASTGLSQATIAGGSLASILVNLPQRHPWDPTRWLIDFDLALILTPALLLGVSAGDDSCRLRLLLRIQLKAWQ